MSDDDTYTIDLGGLKRGTITNEYFGYDSWVAEARIGDDLYIIKMDAGTVSITPPKNDDRTGQRMPVDDDTGKIMQHALRYYYPNAVVSAVYEDLVTVNSSDPLIVKWKQTQGGFQAKFTFAGEPYTIDVVKGLESMDIKLKRDGTLNPVASVNASQAFSRDRVYSLLSLVGPLVIDPQRRFS